MTMKKTTCTRHFNVLPLTFAEIRHLPVLTARTIPLGLTCATFVLLLDHLALALVLFTASFSFCPAYI